MRRPGAARLLACLITLLGPLLLGGGPAYAGDDSCPSDRDIVGTQADSVTIPEDHDDWWRHTSAIGYHSFTLQPQNGDADLLVYDGTCGHLLCYSINGGSQTETCTVTAIGTVYVLVSYFGGGIPVLYYTLSEAGGTPGVQGSITGSGVARGTVGFSGSGVPPLNTSCRSTSFSFSSDTYGGTAGATAGALVNTAGIQYTGPIEIWGSGGSPCEGASGGTGNITVHASGRNALGGTMSCGPLSGEYLREATAVAIIVTGQCSINTVGTGRVRFLASGQFVPAEPGQGVTSAVRSASFVTEFHVAPS